MTYLANNHIIKPYLEDKKAKLANHHNKIITILRHLKEINTELSRTKPNFTDISAQLYSTMFDKIKQSDKFDELMSHLKSKQYKLIMDKLQELDKSEKEYNQCINSLIPKYETSLTQDIQRVEDLQIFDLQEFLAVIFDYYRRLSINEDVKLIEETHQDDKNNPFFFRRLRLSYQEDRDIINTLNIKHQVVTDLKKAIDETALKILPDLKNCSEKLTLIHNIYNGLSEELNKVIHDAEILGIYGNCRIEDQIKVRRILAKKLNSLFHLKHEL